MRLTSPSKDHPATGPPTATDVPSVMWREHWDLETKRPYYHNLLTNEVTWIMPDGFPTRFQFYYQRMHEESKYGHSTPEHAAAAGKATGKRGLKDRIKDYGMAGLGLYLIIHFGSLGLVFLVILNGVDLSIIARKIGFDVAPADGSSIGATFVVAVAVNKIFNPIQMALTLALAPKLVPVLRRLVVRLYSSST